MKQLPKSSYLLLLMPLIGIVIATTLLKSKAGDKIAAEGLVTADRAATLAESNRTNPDSLALALELLNRSIALEPESQVIYGQKARVLCWQGEYDAALAVLEESRTKLGEFWINQLYEGLINDLMGDSIAANLNYERTIDYCNYQLKKMDKNTSKYNDMLIFYLTVKMLRYGKEEAKEDIELLKQRQDYREGSTIYSFVTGAEHFDRKEHVKQVIGHYEE